RAASMPTLAVILTASACAIAAGYLGAAYVSQNAPFAPSPLFSRNEITAALPSDFPLPHDAQLERTGAGDALPYRIEWRTGQPVNEVAGIMKHRLDRGTWSVKRTTESGEAISVHVARDAAGIDSDVVADVSVAPSSDGSRIIVEFSPLPPTRVDGYDHWLEDRGIVVKNVAPEDYDDLRRR
ncbi:MAG TPA: hypothetical protein VFH62_05205, partial [Dehalococcoidia bacterium]|nr:hypothetical protein [Dehalococcoidia bacterium]